MKPREFWIADCDNEKYSEYNRKHKELHGYDGEPLISESKEFIDSICVIEKTAYEKAIDKVKELSETIHNERCGFECKNLECVERDLADIL